MEYHYRMYGLKIISDREMVQLLTEERACILDREEGVNNSNLPTVHIHKGIPNFIREIELCKWSFGQEESYLTNNTCRMYVRNGEEIGYELIPEGKEEDLNAFLLGYGIAMLIMQRGMLPIHSSGLMKNGKAVLISGESGAGKSSLTACYIERGYDLMADDITAVAPNIDGAAIAYPAFPYQKLCRNEVEKRHEGEEDLIYIDEDKDKYLVPWRGAYSASGKELKVIVYLSVGENEELDIREITGFNKFQIVSRMPYMRALLGKYAFGKEMAPLFLKLAEKIKVISVVRPFGKNTLDEIADRTESMVREIVP